MTDDKGMIEELRDWADDCKDPFDTLEILLRRTDWKLTQRGRLMATAIKKAMGIPIAQEAVA